MTNTTAKEENYIFSDVPLEGFCLDVNRSELLGRIICRYHTAANGNTVELEVDATGLFRMFQDWQLTNNKGGI